VVDDEVMTQRHVPPTQKPCMEQVEIMFGAYYHYLLGRQQKIAFGDILKYLHSQVAKKMSKM